MATETPSVGNVNDTQQNSGGGNSAGQPVVGNTLAAPTPQQSGVVAPPSTSPPPSNTLTAPTPQDSSLAAASAGVVSAPGAAGAPGSPGAPGLTLGQLFAPPGATNSSLTGAFNSSGNFFARLFPLLNLPLCYPHMRNNSRRRRDRNSNSRRSRRLADRAGLRPAAYRRRWRNTSTRAIRCRRRWCEGFRHSAPQDAETLKQGVTPQAFAVLNKLLPEIGFVFYQLMGGGAGGGAPGAPGGGAPGGDGGDAAGGPPPGAPAPGAGPRMPPPQNSRFNQMT